MAFHELRIAEVRQETDDAVSLTFDVPAPLRDAFAFQPGQYLTLRTQIGDEEVRRSYSICSAPGEPLRIGVKRVEGGLFSTWAHQAVRPGHKIAVMPPEGRFVLPPGTGRTILAIAAGSGITPILSVLKSLLASEPTSRATLLYGSRSTGQILFRDELEALKDRFIARLSVLHVLSRERQDIPVLNGRIDASKLDALLPGLQPDIALVCGPAEMIDSVTQALQSRGVPLILSERFTTGTEPLRPRRALLPTPGEAPFATATIRADGISTEIPLARDETILDAALRAGLDLPWSCRGGMCSTCRARVLEGEVDMEVNYGLEPWETKAGYVLTCQSRPTTPTVTIDYDHV